MSYLNLLRLREIASLKSNIIQKGKKYIKPGQKAPKGVQLHKGPKGGTYYLIEDKHMKIGGKHHELIRSKGVTKDQWDEVRQKHLDKGAESVEFIPQPEYGGKEGQKLYNIYVRRGDTDQKIEGKIKADKEKFAHRKRGAMKTESAKTSEPVKEPEWELSEDIFTNRKNAWDDERGYQNKGYKTKIVEGKNEKGRKTYQVHYQKPAPATNVKDRLLQIGGRYWKSDDGSKERVYIDGKAFSEMIGLKTEQYNTGNISSATLKGEPISNSKANKILGYFGLNTYYDLNENTFKGFNPDYIDELEDYIKPLEKYAPTNQKRLQNQSR